MDIVFEMLVWVICIIGAAAICFALIARLIPPPIKRSSAYKGAIDVDKKTSPDAESANKKPAPAPAARTYGWSWAWWLIVLAAVAALGWWGYSHLQSTSGMRTSAPTPKTTGPKALSSVPFQTSADLQESASIGIDVATKDTAGKPTVIRIRSGGKGLFFAEIPDNFSGTVYFKGYVARNYAGWLNLSINGTNRQNLHKGGGRFWKVFSFPASLLHPGTNTFVISSSGEDIIVEKMKIEIN